MTSSKSVTRVPKHRVRVKDRTKIEAEDGDWELIEDEMLTEDYVMVPRSSAITR